jgi:hypothetical protein
VPPDENASGVMNAKYKDRKGCEQSREEAFCERCALVSGPLNL